MRVELQPSHLSDQRLKHSLQQFETMLMTQVLAPLMQSQEGDESSSGAQAEIRQVAVEALASGIATHGGIGIARELATRLQEQLQHPVSTG